MTAFAAPIAEQIWDMKYRLKRVDGTIVDETVQDTWRRIAKALAAPERPEVQDHWEHLFYNALEDFKFLPAGRIVAGAGTGRNVTLFNCFVMGTVPDSMSGIFDMLKEAALTMQQGGGIGYDFSTIRPKGAAVKGVAADASGPLTFMDVWDAMCRTVMSAGSRRGAMMATMRCDHPDIEDFITAKQDATRLRMFNLSVLVTDPFMAAVKADGTWDLVFGGQVYRTVQARDLWNKIMLGTYDYAEPGVIFIDRINTANNLNYVETIAATNPCVPAETPILTKQGWWPIKEIVGRAVEAWNGCEWSEVTPSITGHNQRLVKVFLSDGRELTCTPAHKFVLKDGSKVSADQLSVGSQLMKGNWPVIQGKVTYEKAYQQGFFSGDGTMKNEDVPYIYLYGEKKALEHAFDEPLHRGEYAISGGCEGTDLTQTKIYMRYAKGSFLPKDFVPTAEWDVESRLRWFEGLCDSDGCSVRSNNNVIVQISAKDKKFLQDVMLLLNTLGVSGFLSEMKDCWRVGISANNLARLQSLGFAPKRLDVSDNNPQREAARFVRVSEVVELPEIADRVYCFTEPKRHMGCFNGILTGQCGEQPLPPYGACLLGSINLARLVVDPFGPNARLDIDALDDLVLVAVRMMDNVVEASRFPLSQQQAEAQAKRRIGLGVTGLADALLMLGLRYGADDAVAATDTWMRAVARAAYLASVDLAREKGAFPLFDAEKFLASGNMMQMDDDVRDAIRIHGIRNALLTSIAPTGTISLFAGNVSSGIEPVFAYDYTRKVLQKDGSRTEERVEDYAVQMWRKLNGDAALPDHFVNAQTLAPMDHVRMQAAAQKWVDSSISKTINCPEDISFDAFKDVYMAAWDMGCKGCTTYRPNAVTGSVLSVDSDKPKDSQAISPVELLPERPEELRGSTYSIKIGDQKTVYLTINDMIEPDGRKRPFEIFIRSSDPTHDEWMVAMGRMISAIMRRPHDSSFVGAELMQISSAVTGGFQKGKGYQPSLVAAIGAKIKEHVDGSAPVLRDGAKSKPCPKCNSYNTKNEGGCLTCVDCGHSKCG